LAYYLGIDLGTTYTAAASERAGVVESLTLGNRSASVPSVVFLRDDGEILVGEAATRRATSDPGRVAREFKRRVGDPTPIILGGTPYAAEMLMARVLRWSVDRVREQQGEEPRAIALTHPANWGHYKLDLLTQAVRQVDLDAALLLAEPVAAATYYASQRRLEPDSVVAVYDLGGGTFDAAAVRRTADSFEIIGSPEGIERLGGIDFDEAVFAHVRQAVGDALDRLDPEEPAAQAAVSRLRQECIDAKEALSSDTDVSIPVLLPGLQTEVRLTRAEFEAMIRPAIGETIVALRRAVRSAGVDAGDIGAVLLVGGSSRIPLVAQMVGAELGRPIAIDAHPKDAIAFGAAIAVAARRGAATPESVTTLLPTDTRPPPPTVTPDAGWVRARGNDPRPAPPPGYRAVPNGGAGVRPPAPVPATPPAARPAPPAPDQGSRPSRPAPPVPNQTPADPGVRPGAPVGSPSPGDPGVRPSPTAPDPGAPPLRREPPAVAQPAASAAPAPGATGSRPAPPVPGAGGGHPPAGGRPAPPTPVPSPGAPAPGARPAPAADPPGARPAVPGGFGTPVAPRPTPSGERPVAGPAAPGAFGTPPPTPFGGTPRAGSLGGMSSGGHTPPLAPYTGGGTGGGDNRTLWIALAALVAVAVVALVAFTQLGGDDDNAGGGGNGSRTTTTESGTGGYTPEIEANFLDSCTGGGAVSDSVCQCTYDTIEAEIPFDRFMEIDAELNENPDAQPQELVDIVNQCSEEAGA
jgi:actin-like ATPase involved in cell morphogenesis